MARKAGMSTGVEVARISVKVSPDTKEFRRELKNELEEIERTLKGRVEVKADLDSAQARADFMRMKAQMERDRVKIHVDVDRSPLDKLEEAVTGGGSDKKKNRKFDLPGDGFFGPRGNLMPGFGSGINPGGWIAIAAGVLMAAQPVIGLIATSIMALPGLIASVMAPIGAVTLGIKGIADAALEAGLTGQTVGKKGKVKTTVGQAIQDLQSDVSAVFKSNLVPVFEKIIGIIDDPRIHVGFETIATGLSKMADGFVSAVASESGMEKIKDTLTNIGNGLGQMSPGIGSFTDAIITLADEFSKKLPGIADWFNKSMAGFDNWVNEMAKSGGLSGAFDNLGAAIKTVLDWVVELGKHGIEFLKDPHAIDGFLGTLRNIGNALQNIADLSGKINKAWDFIFGSVPTVDSSNAQDFGVDPNGPLAGLLSVDGNGRGGDTKTQVDGLTNSVKEAGAAAAASKPKVDALLLGGAGPGTAAYAGGKVETPQQAATGPKVPPPDTTEAKAALQDYKQTATTAMQETKTAVEQATSNIKPPDLSPIKNELQQLPQAGTEAMSQLTSAITDGGSNATNAALGVAEQCVAALKGMSAAFSGVGMEMMIGLGNGIRAGQSFAITAAVEVATAALNAAKGALGIKSPSRKFMEVGDYAMQGLGKGMENGIQPVLDQARDMAQKVTDAFASGADPTSVLDGFTSKEESRMEKVLAWQSKRLNAQARALDRQYKVSKDENLKAQADAIRAQKDEIDSQKDMLDLAAEFADLQNGDKKTNFAGSPLGKMVEDLTGIPQDFFGQTAGQFMNDIGISGNGALEAIGQYAQGFANKYVFNVSNIDEALAVQQRQQNRQSLGVVGR